MKTRRAGSSPQGLIQGVRVGARCIVTSSQVMLLLLLLLLWEPGFENQIPTAKEGSRGGNFKGTFATAGMNVSPGHRSQICLHFLSLSFFLSFLSSTPIFSSFLLFLFLIPNFCSSYSFSPVLVSPPFFILPFPISFPQ